MAKMNTKLFKVDERDHYECYKNDNHDKIEFDEYVDKNGNVSEDYIRVTIYNWKTKVFDGVMPCSVRGIMLDVFDDVNDLNIACIARFMREAVNAEKAVHFCRG